MQNINKFFLNLIIALNIAYITACFAVHVHHTQANFFLTSHSLIKHIEVLYSYNDAPIYMNHGVDVLVYASVACLFSFCIGLNLQKNRNLFNKYRQIDRSNTDPERATINEDDSTLNVDKKIFIDIDKVCANWSGNIAHVTDNSGSTILMEQIEQMSNQKNEKRLLLLLDDLSFLGNVLSFDSDCILLSTEKINMYLLLIKSATSSLKYSQHKIIILNTKTGRMFYPLLRDND